jgi:hypothetical protein
MMDGRDRQPSRSVLSRIFTAKPRSLWQIWLEAIGLGALFFLLFGVLLHELPFGLGAGVFLAVGRGGLQAVSRRRADRE